MQHFKLIELLHTEQGFWMTGPCFPSELFGTNDILKRDISLVFVNSMGPSAVVLGTDHLPLFSVVTCVHTDK